ncbi:ATP-binding protein [Aeromonas hydrophila]|uniref:ATP-binding protein n=1 Tax=Aeromonas hydrophila TaxID=644 RepID=UPI0004ADDA3C|nr:transporter substrate-binding domain-containing protein [Aeromonas hydrophila]BDC82736.1 virulence sensor protein BvgS [Aeromonas hydrophila]
MKFIHIATILTSLFLSTSIGAFEQLKLVGRSLLVSDDIAISKSEEDWLSKRETLNVGIIFPSYEPFEVISTDGVFEGMSADILTYLSKELNKKITVKGFDDNKSAMSAMIAGDIDILSIGSWFNVENIESIGTYSEPFLKSKLVFSTLKERVNKYRSIPDGTRVAAPKGIVDNNTFSILYPNLRLVEYLSPLAAMDAVYFGRADILLSDIYSTHYLSGERFGDFVFVRHIDSKSKDFGFFVSKNTPELLSIINKGIISLQNYGRVPIVSRWGGAITDVLSASDILSPYELDWILERKKIIVGINKNNVPYSFIGHEGKPAGIAIDVLNTISRLGGIDFDLKVYDSDREVEEAVISGDIDLIATYGNKRKIEPLVSTFNYNRDDIITLTSDRMSMDNGGRFVGNTIAISESFTNHGAIQKKYPNVDIIYVSNGLDALRMLSEGTVNGAITSLYQAKYFFSTNRLLDKYLFLERVSDSPLEFSFAMRSSELQLLYILNKIIKAIPPSDLSRISYSWRNNPLPQLTLWESYTTELTSFFFIFVSAFILYFVRSYYLHKELLHKKVLEEKLLDELSFNKALLNGQPMPISVRNEHGQLIFCNQSYLESLHVTPEEVIGKTLSESFEGRINDVDLISDIYNNVLSSGTQSIQDLSIELDGNVVQIYQWVFPFKDVSDNIKGIICGAIDVTDRKLLQLQLEVEKEKAEQANIAKSNFLAAMSHELRTPMNAIIGFIELSLQKSKDGEIDTDSLNRASEAADTLLELVGGILDISSIEAMKFTINNKPTALNKVVGSTVELLQEVASAQNNKLTYITSIDNSLNVLIDPVRLRQIIYNVVGNSLKFTSNGFVQVELKLQGSSIFISVKDNGVGIPKEKLDDVFLPFSQAHNNYQSGYTGSGLGLSIVKQICEIMGGNVSLSSNVGIGTSVTIILPLVKYNEELSKKSSAPSRIIKDEREKNNDINILVVDDHIANRVLMERQLMYIGYNVLTASDGVEALDIYNREIIDLIITDCQMPRMDGYELTRKIRQKECNTESHPIGIFGLTASAMQNDFDRCIESGMDDCLFKPFKLNVMSEKIHQYFEAFHTETEIVDNSSDWRSIYYNKFIECNKSDFENITKCMRDSDLDGVLHYIHSLKGSCQMIGLNDVVNLCKTIEKSYEESKSLRGDLVEKIGAIIYDDN